MKPLYALIIAMVFYSAPSVAQGIKESSDSLFIEAIKLYSDGKYEEALNDWLVLYNSANRSAALDYNIGNAYFKLGNVPGSILFYERALLLKPADEDIHYNLQVARTLAVDKFSEIPEVFFITWFNFISLSLSTNTWAVISLISFVLFLLLLSLYIYSRVYKYKVLGFWLAILMSILSLSSFSFSSRNRNLVLHNKHAIIFSPLVNGKSSPDDSGTNLFILHEGTKVSVEDQVGAWYEIRLSDGNKGWGVAALRAVARPGGAALVVCRAVIDGIVRVDARGIVDADIKIADGVIHGDAVRLVDTGRVLETGRPSRVADEVVADHTVCAGY